MSRCWEAGWRSRPCRCWPLLEGERDCTKHLLLITLCPRAQDGASTLPPIHQHNPPRGTPTWRRAARQAARSILADFSSSWQRRRRPSVSSRCAADRRWEMWPMAPRRSAGCAASWPLRSLSSASRDWHRARAATSAASASDRCARASCAAPRSDSRLEESAALVNARSSTFARRCPASSWICSGFVFGVWCRGLASARRRC